MQKNEEKHIVANLSAWVLMFSLFPKKRLQLTVQGQNQG